MLKRIVIIGCFFAFVLTVFGQSSHMIRGKLINKKTGDAVSFASVFIQEAEQTVFSDDEGQFSFTPSNVGSVTLEIQCLGFETYIGKFDTSALLEKGPEISMIPISYDMSEITVLSKNDHGITTSSVIGSAAIEYVQPSSLSEVMQLLPGNLLGNPNLSMPQKVSIRDIRSDNNSALGASVVVDGAPLSNDANLQTFSTSRSDNGFTTVAGSGIDLRQLSTDQIESVEVVRGIPSVTYGDLTSGAVVVNTKSGYTPFEIKLKTDPAIKQVSMGKGINLKSAGSSVNFNFDYLQSFDDLRSRYKGFNRVTAEIGFSKRFGRPSNPLTYRAKLSFYGTIDDAKTDPDAMAAQENILSKDRGVRLNMQGKWSPKLKLLTNIDYSLAISSVHQTSSEEVYRSISGIQIISTSLVEGKNQGIFLPSEQFSAYTIDGRPLSFFGQITANKMDNIRKGTINKLLYGVDYRLNANYGRGQIYDVANPPFVELSRLASRPRIFRDIPPVQNLAAYVEDKLTVEIGKTVLDVQAGYRLNNFQSSGLFRSKLGFYGEPRFNSRFWFLSSQNNRIFDKMAVSLGIGKNYKAPPLLFLYPDKAYFDLSALSYYTGNPDTRLSVVDTRIFETGNPELKPAESLKLELGLVFKIGMIDGFFSFFHEDIDDGFGLADHYLFLSYDKYQVGDIPPEVKPDTAQLTRVPAIAPVNYKTPVNNQKITKTGLEFGIDFGRLPAIYTSFVLDGALMRSKQILSTIPVQYQPESENSNPYLFYGVYPAGEELVAGRLNTNLRTVTQIPKLRMILSTTFQVIWYDMYYYPRYAGIPQYLVYSDGSTQVFTSEMQSSQSYSRFINLRNPTYYLKEVMPPLLMTNFRLSKEINDRIKLSFYANNLVNHRPEYQFKRSGSFVRRNPSVYFGAEMKITL